MVIILNPKAANGKAGKLKAKIEAELVQQGLEPVFLASSSADHAMQLAREATKTESVVVAIGGDGTIHHIANGIIQGNRDNNTNTALGIVPLGTGNDFVKMLDIPLKRKSAIKILANRKRKAVDYGTVHFNTQSEKRHCYFVNTLGVGFDAEVASRVAAFKALSGFLAYLAAVFSTLHSLHKANIQIILDHQTNNPFYEGDFLLSSVGNGHTSGGLFKLTPEAHIIDGKLDVCVIKRVSVPRLIVNIPRVLRGTPGAIKEYRAQKAQHIVLSINAGLPVHADGEVLATDVNHLEIEIVKKGLDVIAG